MKYKKLRISILFVICMTLVIAPKVNAKTSIEIKANGNITGVMDWGMNWTYTAGLRTDYQDITDETIKGNISSLVANVNNNRYVDIFPISNWNDLPNIAAYSRWYHDSLGVYTGAKNAIIGCRGRLFAMQCNTGAATKEYTFRPVITGN